MASLLCLLVKRSTSESIGPDTFCGNSPRHKARFEAGRKPCLKIFLLSTMWKSIYVDEKSGKLVVLLWTTKYTVVTWKQQLKAKIVTSPDYNLSIALYPLIWILNNFKFALNLSNLWYLQFNFFIIFVHKPSKNEKTV